MKTPVTTIVEKIKRRSDYSIVDSDLDTLVLDALNDSLKLIKQYCYNMGLYEDISKQITFKTVYNQPYKDLLNAQIVGNTTSFTAVAGDTISIAIDGAATVPVILTGAASISDVVGMINGTVGLTNVASVSGLGYLVVTSPTSISTSRVTISQTAGIPLARLFNSSADWDQSAISDLDEILAISERSYKFCLLNIPYQDFVAMYPDPDAIRAVVPDVFARWYNRLYFGPTPNAYSTLYMDYIFDVTEVALGGTLPYDNEYDPLIIAMCKLELMEWLDSTNATGISAAKAKVKEMKDELITLAAKNVKQDRQTASRRNMIPYFSPRKKIVA